MSPHILFPLFSMNFTDHTMTELDDRAPTVPIPWIRKNPNADCESVREGEVAACQLAQRTLETETAGERFSLNIDHLYSKQESMRAIKVLVPILEE